MVELDTVRESREGNKIVQDTVGESGESIVVELNKVTMQYQTQFKSRECKEVALDTVLESGEGNKVVLDTVGESGEGKKVELYILRESREGNMVELDTIRESGEGSKIVQK